MKSIKYVAIPAPGAAITLGATACGGGSSGQSAAQPSAAVLDCPTVVQSGNTIQADVQAVVADQKSQDQSSSENWVNLIDGSLTAQGNDLNRLVGDIKPYKLVAGAGLTTDVNRFYADATTFISDQSNGLVPSWSSEYDALKADIYKLGKDC